MMITLVLNTSLDPFIDYPQLQTIWPKALGDIASAAVAEEMADIGYSRGGRIYLIEKDAEVIGITGFYQWYHDAGLRWHGIIPEHRGQGISQEVITRLAQVIDIEMPGAEYLVENVPQSAYGKTLESHFAKLGFVPFGEPEKYEWSPDTWQPHRAPIKQILDSSIQRHLCPR